MGTQKLIIAATTTIEQDHKVINTVGLGDPDISWKAKGMHAYIRTHAGGWLKNQEGLVGASTDGRDAVRAGIQELIERKYLHRATIRNEQGRIAYHAYISVPTPMDLTLEQINAVARGEQLPLPQTGLPVPGNPFVVASRDVISINPSGNTNHYSSYNPSGYSNTPDNPSGYQVVLPPQAATKQNIMEFWNTLPNLPTHKITNSPTKTLTKNTKALTKALKHHSPMVIKDAMQSYNDLLVAPYTTLGHVPTKTAPVRVALYEFFTFDPKHWQIISKKTHPLCGVESWFNECRRGPDHLMERFATLRKDLHPKVTARLTTMWDNLVGIDNSAKEKNALRQAGERLKAFIELNKPRFRDFRLATTPAVVDRLEQLLASKEGANLHTGWLYSDITWVELEKYLVDQNVIKERRKPARRANA